MLTDLSFLDVGQQWPPASESERLERYEKNEKLFLSKHDEVYQDQLLNVKRVIGDYTKESYYPIVLNFNKIITLKSADLLMGESPVIQVGENGSNEAETFEQIKIDSDLFNTLYQVCIDISRYGDGLMHVYKDSNDVSKIGVTPTKFWYPVVNEDNIKEFKYHVLAWQYGQEIESTDIEEQNAVLYRLKVQIHEKGKVTYALLALSSYNGTITEVLETEEVFTGLDDFAIVPVSNTVTSDEVNGIDDYRDIDDIVSSIISRISQISNILDKHADPSMQAPISALEFDTYRNEYKLKLANCFIRNDTNDPEVSYLTWDSELDAAFRQIENLQNYLYTISEMGSAIFGDLTKNTGSVPSGSALKRLMISPLSKVNRVRTRFDLNLKKAVRLAMQLENYNDTQVSITWRDGLPDDNSEKTQILTKATNNKAIMSQYTAVKIYQQLDDEQTEDELMRINVDESLEDPTRGSNIAFTAKDEISENEELEAIEEMAGNDEKVDENMTGE